MDQTAAAIKIQAFYRSKRVRYWYKQYQQFHMYRAFIEASDPLALNSPLVYSGQEKEFFANYYKKHGEHHWYYHIYQEEHYDEYDAHHDIYQDQYEVVAEEDDDQRWWCHSEDEDDDFIPCCVCGSDCSGGNYESWRLCSRACMRHED